MLGHYEIEWGFIFHQANNSPYPWYCTANCPNFLVNHFNAQTQNYSLWGREGGGGVLYWCPIFFWDSYKLHGCTAQLGLWTVYSVVLHCYILCIVSMTMNRIYMSLTTWTKCDIKHLRLNIEMVKCNCDRIEIYNVISFWICSQNSVSKEETFPILKSFSHLDKKLLITLKNMICSSTMLCESPEYYVSLILKGLKLKVLFDCQMPLLMCKLHI